MIDLTDQVFGRLTVKEQVENESGYIRWLCQCTCGNYKIIRGDNLRAGTTQSCGCLRQELKEDAEHRTIHAWLKRNKLKPELCERCKERPPAELSYNNIDKKGYSRNPEDYQWLCISCHNFKDRGNGTTMTKARIYRIREFHKCGAATQRELAKLFKVSTKTIFSILHYEGAYQKI